MALYGIDVSMFQSPGVQGDDFTIIRATYGTGYVDDNCDSHYQLAKQQGKLRGVYHYAYPQYNAAVDEANWFIDNVQGYIGDAILVLDWEEGDKTNVSWVRQFLDQVYARTKVRPLVYMSASVTTSADWSSVANDTALYCAGYPARFDVRNPPVPAADGSDMTYHTGAFPYATIWQYTSSAGTLDRNIAYMTPQAWHSFAIGDRNVPAPTPTPDPTPAEPSEPPVEEPTPSTDTPASPVEEPSPVPTPDPTPEEPTEQTPPKVIVPKPAYYKLWELIVAIFKKLIGKK